MSKGPRANRPVDHGSRNRRLLDRQVTNPLDNGPKRNPKGIVSSSSGLRGTSYPGLHGVEILNPERVSSPLLSCSLYYNSPTYSRPATIFQNLPTLYAP